MPPRSVARLRRPLELTLRFLYRASHRGVCGLNPQWQPRHWSNHELRRWAHLFEGEMINVSAWKDLDKQGRRYRDYFPNVSSYHTSNYCGARGATGVDNEFELDLSAPLPRELNRRFDVVLNHTTLEHVYDARLAMANMCAMTRDLVVVVVPFLQPLHWEPEGYRDYWRFGPAALRVLFFENGLETVYVNSNANSVYPIYYFAVGSRRPDVWRPKFSAPVLRRRTVRARRMS